MPPTGELNPPWKMSLSGEATAPSGADKTKVSHPCRPNPGAGNDVGEALLVTRPHAAVMRWTGCPLSRHNQMAQANLLSVVHRREDLEQFRQLGSGERCPDCTTLNPYQAERNVQFARNRGNRHQCIDAGISNERDR